MKVFFIPQHWKRSISGEKIDLPRWYTWVEVQTKDGVAVYEYATWVLIWYYNESNSSSTKEDVFHDFESFSYKRTLGQKVENNEFREKTEKRIDENVSFVLFWETFSQRYEWGKFKIYNSEGILISVHGKSSEWKKYLTTVWKEKIDAFVKKVKVSKIDKNTAYAWWNKLPTNKKKTFLVKYWIFFYWDDDEFIIKNTEDNYPNVIKEMYLVNFSK